MSTPLVEMVNIHKWFGSVHALKGVDFFVNHGEIVGLVGDNGAGKSTLIKILSGLYPPDEGKIFFEGKEVKFRSPKDAIKLGIETVYQDQMIIPYLNVYRNIFLGRELEKRLGPLKVLDVKGMKEKSWKLFHELGLDITSLDVPVQALSGGQRQGVVIARAMYFKTKLLILDEPTNNLSIKEARKVLDMVLGLKKAGISCIFITHNLHHVYPAADRIVILNRGKKIADFRKDQITIDQIEEMIISG
ncbi:MAG: ATP-binding cassette domain-containing protein [Fervidicoccaceae archaeon]